MRYKIILSYNGSAFSGWQFQPNAPSVQQALEQALETLLGSRTEVVGAGRTDAGVNARNYVAHFDCMQDVEPRQLSCKLNAILPKAVAIHDISLVDDDFHARFSARLREYKYYIHTSKDPFDEAFSWQCGYPLDIERMNRACSFLPGTHDCHCFEKTGSDNANSLCEIFYARWEVITCAGGVEGADGVEGACGGACARGGTHGRKLVFTIAANRFLRNMVRAVVGTMIDIGRGRHEPEYILELLDHGTRSDAGQSVPGHALFLNRIEY